MLLLHQRSTHAIITHSASKLTTNEVSQVSEALTSDASRDDRVRMRAADTAAVCACAASCCASDYEHVAPSRRAVPCSPLLTAARAAYINKQL